MATKTKKSRSLTETFSKLPFVQEDQKLVTAMADFADALDEADPFSKATLVTYIRSGAWRRKS